LDFLTGKKRRAPRLLRFLNLEWLWRLINQPNRAKRIFNAVFVFSLTILKNKFIHPFFYRPNVACFLYKKTQNSYKVLLVKRNGEEHWQLVQGGTDGESLLKAGARELYEETNCNKFIPKKTYPNIHKYKFPPQKKEEDEKRKHTGFKGQKQGLFIAEFTGNDNDIKINFWDHSEWKWEDLEKLETAVHPIRISSIRKFITKFKETTKNK